MRTKQNAFAWALLWLFAGILASCYLSPPAAPLNAQETQITILEDDNIDYKGDLLRSSDTQQEGTKHTNDFQSFHVDTYHSECANVRTAQNAEREAAAQVTTRLYIFNSCFLI